MKDTRFADVRRANWTSVPHLLARATDQLASASGRRPRTWSALRWSSPRGVRADPARAADGGAGAV